MLPILALALRCRDIAHAPTVVAVYVSYARRCTDFVSDAIATVIVNPIRGVVIQRTVFVIKGTVFIVKRAIVIVKLTVVVIKWAVVVVHGLLSIGGAACNKQ